MDTFNVTSSGDIILKKPLDYETVDNYNFLVFATDGYMVKKKIQSSFSLNALNQNLDSYSDFVFLYVEYKCVSEHIGTECKRLGPTV